MKIAYLIAAHSDAKQLKRTIDALDIKDVTDFYIHIDKKAEIGPFVKALESGYDNCRFTKERIFTQWGGFSQCRYQETLITECINSGNKYDRVFFISGLDYPLWSNSRIIKELEQNPDKEYICGMSVTTCDSPPKIKKKITLYHFFRDIEVRDARIKRIFSGGSRIMTTLLPFRKKTYINDGGRKLEVFQGSSWWCLTWDCLNYVATQFKNKNITAYFKTSFAPDEMRIQTIVFNSRFAEKSILYEGEYPGLVGLTPLHTIHYDGAIKIFTEADYDEIKKKDRMFFRKAVSCISDRLLDMVDNDRKLEEHL